MSSTLSSLENGSFHNGGITTTNGGSGYSGGANSIKIPAIYSNVYRYEMIVRNNCPKFLLPIIIIGMILLMFVYTKDSLKFILLWIGTQNKFCIFLTFIVLFTIVSFPITIGYLILIITSGYYFGLLMGLLTVVLGANIGAAIAQYTIKRLKNKLPIQRLLKNETGKAILRVIAGPKAFKVVLLARLTPIPFGIQNTIFGISNVQPKCYYPGTLLGLFPAQFINVYFGTSLRSIHDVLSTQHNTALASYVVFAIQICIGILLMGWILHRARRELTEALLLDIDSTSDYSIIVEVQS